MCEPVSATAAAWMAAGTFAASSAVALYAKNQQNHAIAATAKLQQEQTNDQAQQQTNERIAQAREARAKTRVAAAESGLVGNSLDAVMSNIQMQEGMDVSLVEKNRENQNVSTKFNASSQKAANNTRAGVQIAKSAAGSYGQYQTSVAQINSDKARINNARS